MAQEEFRNRYQYNPATDKLGENGMGNVFKAYDTHRDRWVALKISKVNPDYESIRLRKETETTAQLPSHPNIACYEDCYTFTSFDGEYDFGILQYYEQGNLLQLLKRDGLSSARKQSILAQIFSGIEFLHAHGIAHLNLKPQNILMVKRGEEYIPKITGFGSSVAGAGTPTYASPEQSGGNAVGKNSDLWSFGVIAYQTFTGELPFAGGEQALSAINGIDEPWQQLILACLVPDPEKRVKDCTECIAILKGETWGESKQQEVCNEDKTIETQKPELWPKLEQESWSKPKPWTKSEQEPWSKPKPWTKSEQNPTPKPILEPQPKPKSEPKSKPEPKSESEPKSEKKTKSLTHKLLKNLITVIIAGIAVISNPSEEEHKKAAKPVLKQILTKEEINKIIHGKTFLEGIMNNEILSEIMLDAVYNELIARENYILFSTTTVTFGGKTERIGIGAFGKVWIPKPKP